MNHSDEEEASASILQRIYFNPALKTVDLKSNNITMTTFRNDYLKRY